MTTLAKTFNLVRDVCIKSKTLARDLDESARAACEQLQHGQCTPLQYLFIGNMNAKNVKDADKHEGLHQSQRNNDLLQWTHAHFGRHVLIADKKGKPAKTVSAIAEVRMIKDRPAQFPNMEEIKTFWDWAGENKPTKMAYFGREQVVKATVNAFKKSIRQGRESRTTSDGAVVPFGIVLENADELRSVRQDILAALSVVEAELMAEYGVTHEKPQSVEDAKEPIFEEPESNQEKAADSCKATPEPATTTQAVDNDDLCGELDLPELTSKVA